MGQWSLPNTSLLMSESLTRPIDLESTRKQSSRHPIPFARPPVRTLHHEYLTDLGYSSRKVSTHPLASILVKLSLSSFVKPAVFSLPLGLAMSISWWTTFRSPQITTAFLSLSSLTQFWKHLSHSSTRYLSLSSFCPELGTQEVTRKNCSNSMVRVLPSWECCFWGRSYVTAMGRCLEKMATPEYPAEHLQKFQQPWQPSSWMGLFVKTVWSILVSPMQRMSGCTRSTYFCRSLRPSTALTPLTFHELISSFWPVSPLPQSHMLVWFCSRPFLSPRHYSVNCLDRLLVAFSGSFPGSCTVSLEKSLVCFSFLSCCLDPSAF